jgi:hypothetical protein
MFQIIFSRSMPATLTRMSILPNASTHWRTIAPGLLVIGDRVVIGDGLAAGFLDLRHHVVGRALIGGLAAAADARIVDDDGCAMLGHQQRDIAADAAAGAGDDCGLAFEIFLHVVLPGMRLETAASGALPAFLPGSAMRGKFEVPCAANVTQMKFRTRTACIVFRRYSGIRNVYNELRR